MLGLTEHFSFWSFKYCLESDRKRDGGGPLFRPLTVIRGSAPSKFILNWNQLCSSGARSGGRVYDKNVDGCPFNDFLGLRR